MACSSRQEKYGYELSRFENDVDENFHCSICYNVLKDPRTCKNNDHVFCLDCITEHLRVNSQTCPECNEHLSVETLHRPRVVTNYLSKLKINCDYASRGCLEYIPVENLESHVARCGFAPVSCSNENCCMVINKQEREHHETVVCEYRKLKCHECEKIQENVETLKGNLTKMEKKAEAARKEVKDNHDETKNEVGKLKGSMIELDGKVETIKRNMENNHVETKRIVGKFEASYVGMNKRINENVETLRNRHDEMKQEQHEVKKEIKDVKENVSKLNKDVDEVKMMMSQMLEKMNMFEMMNKLTSPTEGIMNTPREDILIAGHDETVEIFSWEKNGWYEVATMNEMHIAASSFIHNDQLFIVGGYSSKTIETLNLNELPLKWMKFPGELPYEGGYHQTVVYQQRVIHIGGYNDDERKVSNMISELQLTSPCTMKKLCEMPEPRWLHGAEIFEDKVLILGGGNDSRKTLNSVLEFDPKRNKCKETVSLPHPLQQMATLLWRDQVVVLGGRNKDKKVLNDVFMYDCKTGKITVLPSMLEKRCVCCAVITGNTIVVMGGWNEKNEDLNSVECFTMGGSTWKHLPAMNKKRCGAVAEVLPSRRKYV